MRKLARWLAVPGLFAMLLGTVPATADHIPADHQNMENLFQSGPTGYTNSDLAFWGNMAAQGHYNGFRLFDISDPANPVLLSNTTCPGNQMDVSLFDRNADGVADILFGSVDQVMDGPECGAAAAVDPEDPGNWEGIRIFDITNPAAPTQMATVYQDCGSHTHTLWPDAGNNRVLLWNSSYPLRSGPTCGPTAGPANGRDALHGVIQVVQVAWDPGNPLGAVTATEIAEPPITYPGDPDNKWEPTEHGLPASFNPMRACHDIGVFPGLNIAGGACAEQAQLWRVGANGIPDTANPIWVYDDPVDETGVTGNPNDTGVKVDFWHSATFSWDGSTVIFIDESLDIGGGEACPPTTTKDGPIATAATIEGDTGRMFFLDAETGEKYSHYMIPRTEPGAYCSSHLGIPVPTKNNRDILVNAWYEGGINVMDFTNPRNPKELAFFDYHPDGGAGSDNWAAYWYEGSSVNSLTIYATDGFGAGTDRGFLSFRADVNVPEYRFSHLNPQTQGLLCKGKAGTIFGTPGADIIKGTPADDVIIGGDGNDRIRGLGGNDLICGGRGKDKISGGAGKDRIFGEQGKDKLRGGGGKDKLIGGPGEDHCNGGPGKDKARQCEKVVQVP